MASTGANVPVQGAPAATPIARKPTQLPQRAALPAASTRGTHTQRSVRPPQRPSNNSFKNQVHAQDVAAKFKAAYNTAGPAIVSIVENAAAYFEGKDTPEAIVDKEKSFERYQFNVDMLTEIFDGPLPEIEPQPQQNVNNPNAAPTPPTAPTQNGPQPMHTSSSPTKAPPATQSVHHTYRDRLMQRIGEKMLTRTHEERMAELENLRSNFSQVESRNRDTEKASMRLFQKLDRAATLEELENIRSQYEESHHVQFVEAPPPIVKRKLDKSLPEFHPAAPATILKFPEP